MSRPCSRRIVSTLDAVEFVEPTAPLVNNADACIVKEPAALRDGLKRQVTAPVRWEESIRALRSSGVEVFVEAGPGKVLSGLMRQIDRQAECLGAEDVATLDQVATRLRGAGAAN